MEGRREEETEGGEREGEKTMETERERERESVCVKGLAPHRGVRTPPCLASSLSLVRALTFFVRSVNKRSSSCWIAARCWHKASHLAGAGCW